MLCAVEDATSSDERRGRRFNQRGEANSGRARLLSAASKCSAIRCQAPYIKNLRQLSYVIGSLIINDYGRLERKTNFAHRGEFLVSETVARANALKRNIQRYESLLDTNLSELEMQYIRRQFAEERLKLAELRFKDRGDENIKHVA